MTQHALVRGRRFKPKEPTLRLISFQLRHHWFCLPLAQARRVLPEQSTQSGLEVGLIQLQNEAIPVINAATLVFGGAMPQLPGTIEPSAKPLTMNTPPQSILVVDLSQGGAAGLLIDGTPAIKRVRPSALKPVPPMYLTIHRLKGIRSVIDLQHPTPAKSSPPLFLLDIDSLLPHA